MKLASTHTEREYDDCIATKHYSGHCKAIKEEGDQGALGKRDVKKERCTEGFKNSWTKKTTQQDLESMNLSLNKAIDMWLRIAHSGE